MTKNKKRSRTLAHIRNENYSIYLKETNVLTVETAEEVEYGEALVNDVMENINKICSGKKKLLLVVAGVYSSINLEGLKALARPKGSEYAHAKAYVINSLAQRLSLNFFVTFFNPTIPIKTFTDRTAAEVWLLKNYRHLI